MYHPGNWGAWVSDGMAHANLLCAMWLVALAWRSTRLANYLALPPSDPLRHSVTWCLAGAALNLVLVLLHLRAWQWQMGY